MYAHIDTYNSIRLQTESKRVSRTLKGTERVEANARMKRLEMAQGGLSSTNLVFNTDLAYQTLYNYSEIQDQNQRELVAKEILEILKDDPEKDSGIMYTRVPTDAQTSTIAESDSTGGYKPLDTDSDDDDQYSFITGFDLSDLDHIASGSERVINRLPYFIHDLKRWQGGFQPSKFYKAEALRAKQALAACVDSDSLTVNGTIRKRKAETKPRRKRVPRKARTHTKTLMAG